jgi:hypothetical protein
MPRSAFCVGYKSVWLAALLIAAVAAFACPAHAQQVVLLVNGTPITDRDIAHREKFIEMSSRK